MAEHPGLTHIQDRKDLLLTARQILTDYAANRNMYKEGQPAESLRDGCRKMVLNLLIDHREKEKKKAKDSLMKQTVVYSSESESENSTSSDFQCLFESVLDDYLGVKSGGNLFKNLERKTRNRGNSEENQMKFYSYVYRAFELEYLAKSKRVEIGSKSQDYLSKAQFCNLAVLILENSNSSAILERAFSSSMRCITQNRYQLRHDFQILKMFLSLKISLIK